MELQGGSGDIRDLLVNSCFVLPLAFAVWKFDDDEVFLSNKLKLMISAKQNCLEPYDFVKAMHHSFGSFLNTAVEKVDKAAARQSARNDYASPINILGEEFTLKLSFYAEKQLYVFTADNSKKPAVQNAKTNDAESELKTLLDALPVFIWQKDRNLKITYCNEAYAKALESSKDAVVRDNLKLIPSSKREGYSYQGVYASKARKFTEHVILGGARRLLS
ncbi:MAG: PAS domain-containing protein, partial [Alphaproteobacteria bacterium]|nr:PAS domain-containing protein [Alphaproteobacteria bacterium]